MAVNRQRGTGAPSGLAREWNSIDWRTVKEEVTRLQMRIAKAVRSGKYGRAKALQYILTHSFYAKLLAVRRVVSNKGKKTPGVDGVVWTSARDKMEAVYSLQRRGYRPQPLRRVYIPKRNSHKKRPLSIPCKKDRAMQALHALGLVPIAETTADLHSYGFRKNRRCADAIEQCHITLSQKTSAQWIYEADIEGCFDNISFEWMEQHIPMDRQILRKWLNAGYIERGKLYPMWKGTPQGGIISPTLANMTLDGLEEAVRMSVPRSTSYRSKVHVIRYADDFIVTARSREMLEERVIPAIEAFLATRGLNLSKGKSRVVHIEEGFSFLGQHIRKYSGKMLTKPDRERVKSFLHGIRKLIRRHRQSRVSTLIMALNARIRGWANYHRHVVASRTFSYVDEQVRNALYRWCRRRHPNKQWSWLKKTYWSKGYRKGCFAATEKRDGQRRLYELFRAATVKIRRHCKVQAAATPFDPEYIRYFERRAQLGTCRT